MSYEVLRFPHDGTIDADGHILEPAWLWEEYLEERYPPRAMRVRTDERGLEYLELDGRPSERTKNGVLGIMGAMGDPAAKPGPDRRYMDHIPYGAGDAAERTELLDREHLEKSVLYPTIGLLWECEVTDPEISLAYMRAYNRWIADFCRPTGGRPVPVAPPPPLHSPAGGSWSVRSATGVAGRSWHPSRTPGRPTDIPITTCCSQRRVSWTCRSASIRPTSRRGRCRCGSRGSAAPASSSTTSCCGRACSRR